MKRDWKKCWESINKMVVVYEINKRLKLGKTGLDQCLYSVTPSKKVSVGFVPMKTLARKLVNFSDESNVVFTPGKIDRKIEINFLSDCGYQFSPVTDDKLVQLSQFYFFYRTEKNKLQKETRAK